MADGLSSLFCLSEAGFTGLKGGTGLEVFFFSESRIIAEDAEDTEGSRAATRAAPTMWTGV